METEVYPMDTAFFKDWLKPCRICHEPGGGGWLTVEDAECFYEDFYYCKGIWTSHETVGIVPPEAWPELLAPDINSDRLKPELLDALVEVLEVNGLVFDAGDVVLTKRESVLIQWLGWALQTPPDEDPLVALIAMSSTGGDE